LALAGQREHDVFQGGQVGDEVEGLEDEAEILAPEIGQLLLAEGIEVDTVHPYLAGAGVAESAENGQKGALTRTRWPHDAEKGPLRHAQVDPFQGLHTVRLTGVVFFQSADFDKCHDFLASAFELTPDHP
jgi:hypothetical protein